MSGTNASKIFNLQEAADYLKVNPRTLYRMIQNPNCQIPYQRTSPRGSYRFHKAALDGWLTRSDSDSHTNSLQQCAKICQEKNEAELVETGDSTVMQQIGLGKTANSASGGTEGGGW